MNRMCLVSTNPSALLTCWIPGRFSQLSTLNSQLSTLNRFVGRKRHQPGGLPAAGSNSQPVPARQTSSADSLRFSQILETEHSKALSVPNSRAHANQSFSTWMRNSKTCIRSSSLARAAAVAATRPAAHTARLSIHVGMSASL